MKSDVPVLIIWGWCEGKTNHETTGKHNPRKVDLGAMQWMPEVWGRAFRLFSDHLAIVGQHEAGIFISFHTPERKPCDIYAAQIFIWKVVSRTWATPMYGKPLETLRVLRSNILSPFGLPLPHLVDQLLEHRRFPPPGNIHNIRKLMVWVGTEWTNSGQCWIKASCIFSFALKL